MTKQPKQRPLSEEQAATCETAKNDRCRCRCRGRFHGAERGELGKLPASDPHSPTGRAQCDRGKHVYPKDQAPTYVQKCTRCGQAVMRRRRRWVKGESQYQTGRIH